MKALTNKSKTELIEIRDKYVSKYIGDFDKPVGYKSELKMLDKLIELKQ